MSALDAPPPPPDDAPPPPPPDAFATSTLNSPHPPPPHQVTVPPPPADDDDGLVLPKKKIKTALPKANPLNIEDVLARKRMADEAAAKPKFIPKAERERRAREAAAAVEAQKQLAQTAATSQPFAKSETRANGAQSRSNGTNGTSHATVPKGPKAQAAGSVPAGPAAWRSQQPNKGVDLQPAPPPKAVAIVNGPQAKKKLTGEDVDAADLRQRYMGAEQSTSKFSAKNKRKRTSEKKFNFEWNADEDTSQDHNVLYNTQLEASFFGRGRLGGFVEAGDMEHAMRYAKALEERDPETGKQRAQQYLDMERRRFEDSGGRHTIDKHWSEKQLSNMRERDWRIFKEDFNIATKGGSIPNPMRNWAESGLPQRLLDIVDQAGYKEPSAVQRAAIPIALQARDLIGVAVTGSGKTAAFLLPLLVYISALPKLDDHTKNDGPYAIIMAPTRELAQQIEGEAKKFATPLGFRCVSIVGGHAIEEQAYNMREGAEIIIATPGRLVDCISRRLIVLSQCTYIVLDEADKMVDMGFEEPLNIILDALPVSNVKPDDESAEDAAAMSRYIGGSGRYRQTMMYTATMPIAVERIARKYTRRPAIVTIGNVGEAVDTVEQRVEFVAGEDKRKKRLAEILSSREFAAPIIVFVNIKRNCDAVARDISRMGLHAVTLHGSKTQDQREAALGSLRKHQADVLVATDLAGRGIDVPDVSLVVNFNMATNIESYTHRVGRTGRAGKSGVAITFLGQEDTDVMFDLRKMIQSSSISKLPEELRRHEAAQQPRNRTAKKADDSGGFGGKGGWNQ